MFSSALSPSLILICCSPPKEVGVISHLIYIPKANRPLAEQLAYKNYLTFLLKQNLKEKAAMEAYLHRSSSTLEKSNLYLSEISHYKNLLPSHIRPLSEELEEWMNSPYEKNPNHPKKLIHKTTSGLMVRSKSEAMIAHFLSSYNI